MQASGEHCLFIRMWPAGCGSKVAVGSFRQSGTYSCPGAHFLNGDTCCHSGACNGADALWDKDS